MKPDDFIDALGGTVEVAKLCDCFPQGVSNWKRHGIPKARLQYLKLLRPDLPWADLVQPDRINLESPAT